MAVTARYGNIIKNIRLADCWSCIEVIEADLRNRGALEAIGDLIRKSNFGDPTLSAQLPSAQARKPNSSLRLRLWSMRLASGAFGKPCKWFRL